MQKDTLHEELQHCESKTILKKSLTEALRKFVLVGTYTKGQLERWSNYYNYPLRDDDQIDIDFAKKVNELWLFNGTKGGKFLSVEFVGIKTREELKLNYGYHATGKGHGNGRYLLFKVNLPSLYSPSEFVEKVFVRVKDFAKSSPELARKLKIYLDSENRNDSDKNKFLPKILTELPPHTLCVCEGCRQLDFFPIIEKRKFVQKSVKKKFTAIELFAGAGGLSIGLEKAGIHVVIANEIMHDFALTLAANHPNTKVINEDIHKIDFAGELKKLGLKSIDVLSGGPPCQGFSTIGSKNRMDPRNSLFYEYIRAVAETHPKYTIFENVSGFKRMYGGFAYKTLIKELSDLGYETSCKILNAADYGAPQIRHRTIVLGWRKDLAPLSFPKITHGKSNNLKPYVTLMDAIGDLPELSAGEIVRKYSLKPITNYQSQMRGNQEILLDHNASHYGEKMQEILRIVPPGGSIKDLPNRLRPKSAYSNTYARLIPNLPSPTITRNFGTPSSSRCIHPFQARALSTREGARLQGFPDDYRFVGGKQSKNLQIGNAVPPILGEAIANVIYRALKKEAENEK